MEARKLLGLVIFLFFLGVNPALAYEISTHATLTEAIFDFYNKNFPENKIPEKYKDDLIKGSQEEDVPPRWLYHFYDPVHNRGLTWQGQSWISSKKWAQDKREQTLLASNFFLAMLGEEPIVYTWEQALKLYKKGDKKTAFYVLGHILHLLEDASVPDHTRNDPHPLGSSPYENFTANLKPKIDNNKKPIILENLEKYFDELASYSNNNFYSADTINTRNYQVPKSDKFIIKIGFKYGVKSSEGEFLLVKNLGRSRLIDSDLLTIDAPDILSDYWRLLSQKSIQYGAGVVKLFFEEAEKINKADQSDRTDLFKFNQLALVERAVIDLDEERPKPSPSKAPLKEKPKPKKEKEKKKEEISAPKIKSLEDLNISKFKECSFKADGKPRQTPVIINEVAWMGSAQSAADEWIELKNIGNEPADISGWQILNQDEGLRLRFPENASIAVRDFYLLERTDDDSVPRVKADLIYKGALVNEEEGLRLFDRDCQLVDEVLANPKWPAGDSSRKTTMERGKDLTWHNYYGSDWSGVAGTPHTENSESSGLVTQGPAGQTNQPNQTNQSPPPPPSFYIGKAIINEFLFDAEGSDSNKEFIELRNLTAETISISDWSIQVQSGSGSVSKKNFESGHSLPANCYFLIGLGSAFAPAPDMSWASGSLNNTSATIYLVGNSDKIDGPTDPDVIDKVSYSKDALAGFTAGQSWDKQSGGLPAGQAGWQLQSVPNPQNSTSCSGGNPDDGNSGNPGHYLARVDFFRDSVSNRNVIDLRYSQYPVISGTTDAWKALIFYHNSPPLKERLIDTQTNWTSSATSTLSVTYPIYTNTNLTRSSLILPDIPEKVGSDGGLYNVAYKSDLIEDNLIRLETPVSAVSGDYLTVAYYNFLGGGGGTQVFELKLVDSSRYYFQDRVPAFQPPVFNQGEIAVSFFPAGITTTVAVEWPRATDPDSADRLISYDLTVNEQLINTFGSSRVWEVEPGDVLNISVRAKDEFNNYSDETKSLVWQNPE